MWQPTSLYGLSEKGISGTKQKVNHSLADVVSWMSGKEGKCWRDGGPYHRFTTWPLKLPQFWHWTVRFSAPERRFVKAEGCQHDRRVSVLSSGIVGVEAEDLCSV